MAKLVLSNLTNLDNPTTAVNTINANSDLIEAALDNTLSRNGAAPNQMQADLDMNQKNIINTNTVYATTVSANTFIGSGSIVVNSSNLEFVSISALRAYTVTPLTYGTCRVISWYSGLNKGGGIFYYDNTDTTSADNSGTIIVDTLSRRWKRLSNEILDVTMFGAKSDGVSDDTTAIQSAITASSGKHLYFPAGTYVYSVLTITSNNIKITGAGGATRLITSSATGTCLDIGDGTSEIRNIDISDITLWSSVTKTAGAIIRARKLVRSNLINLRIGTPEDFNTDGNRLYDGITINEFDNVRIEGGYCLTSNNGITAYGNAAQTFGAELFLDGGLRVLRQGNYGIHIAGGAGGIKIDAVDVALCQYGLYVSDTIGLARNREIFIGPRASFDSCTTGNGRGVWFAANSIEVAEFVGTWSATNKVGIDIRPSQYAGATFKFSGIRVYNNQNEGLIIADGNVVLGASSIFLNGQTLAGAHGIDISTANTKGVTIVGNQIKDNGTSGTSYGINIVAACDNFIISNNDLTLNTAGAIQNASGLSATKQIRNNIGYVTENYNLASNTTDVSGDITITHGLSAAPSVIVTSVRGNTAQTVSYAHTNSATTFKIRVRTSSTGAVLASTAVTIDWFARV